MPLAFMKLLIQIINLNPLSTKIKVGAQKIFTCIRELCQKLCNLRIFRSEKICYDSQRTIMRHDYKVNIEKETY